MALGVEQRNKLRTDKETHAVTCLVTGYLFPLTPTPTYLGKYWAFALS